jgi:hypothetical protein
LGILSARPDCSTAAAESPPPTMLVALDSANVWPPQRYLRQKAPSRTRPSGHSTLPSPRP